MVRFSCFAIVALGWMGAGSAALEPTPLQDAVPKMILDLGGGVKMEFVQIKAGKFMMGADEPGERPEHDVTLTKDFWMQTTEVTQSQWEAVTGSNPSEFKGKDLPVETVSWDECAEFLKKLNERVKAQLKGRKAELPTEAEWEYACRAGGKGNWSFGDEAKLADQYAWHDGNAERKTHAAAQKKANAWGLFDMHGNVWEWCSDWYAEQYPAGAAADPTGPATGDCRIRRGGSWDVAPGAHRSSNRERNNPTYRCNYIGLRAVLR
jgi:formylglycine-generating enzyme required for sulfatase activity